MLYRTRRWWFEIRLGVVSRGSIFDRGAQSSGVESSKFNLGMWLWDPFVAKPRLLQFVLVNYTMQRFSDRHASENQQHPLSFDSRLQASKVDSSLATTTLSLRRLILPSYHEVEGVFI